MKDQQLYYSLFQTYYLKDVTCLEAPGDHPLPHHTPTSYEQRALCHTFSCPDYRAR